MSWLINEVSKKTGISKYNLRFYEEEGLISPARKGERCYRCYDKTDIERIYCINLYRQLGISVKDMKALLDEADMNRMKILDRIIEMTNNRMMELKNIVRIAELLRFYANDHKELDEEKRREYAADYDSLVVILGKQIHELNHYYEEKERMKENEE